MRTPLAALTGIAVLFVAGAAFAFEQTPEAPPAQSNAASPPGQNSATLNAPATGAGEPQTPAADTEVFGFGILPKLDFGLELLYGDKQQQSLQLEQQGPVSEDNDVTIVGKIKRHF
jgi:hypothetical protein